MGSSREIWPVGAPAPINHGVFVELGPITTSWDKAYIHGEDISGNVGGKFIDFTVSVSGGNLSFSADRIYMSQRKKIDKYTPQTALLIGDLAM